MRTHRDRDAPVGQPVDRPAAHVELAVDEALAIADPVPQRGDLRVQRHLRIRTSSAARR
jgi:hypothetical protein